MNGLSKTKFHLILPVTKYRLSSLLETQNDRNFGRVKTCVKPWYIVWIKFTWWFGTKLYRNIVGIPMGTNCAPLVADLFLFCYERKFMTSLSDVKQSEIIEEYNSTSRYPDDLLNVDNLYFEGMGNWIYQPELQLNKANTSDTEAPFIGFAFICFKQFCLSKIYYKRDDFDFDIVTFPRSTSYGVYISQLIRFARVSGHVADFNACNKGFTAKLLQQGYRYYKLRKTFSEFYRRHYELVSKFIVGLKTLLLQGLW